jgi:DNA (cytosine-5)-methyltransferase 1
MRLSNTDKVKGMSYEEILDKFPEEICKCCFWPEESHHPESLCEGRYCEEALKKWLEDDSEPLLTHFSLFSGIGGLDLAAEWAGFETVGQCEFADYPTKVLEKHWPDVPRWRDIRSVTADSFFEKTGLRTVDVISGGFPCQPFSVAGKQKGKRDDRYLWPEMLRVIREIKPTWVLGENVPGILRIAGKTVCEDLEREGYAVAVFNYEAAAVGAKHRRDRVFFVAHAKSKQINIRRNSNLDRCEISTKNQQKRESNNCRNDVNRCGQDVADTQSRESRENVQGIQQRPWSGFRSYNGQNRPINGRRPAEPGLGMLADGIPYWLGEYLRVEPDIPRVATGVKNRVEQLKCYGNAVVPQQAYPIFKTIADIEKKY